MVDFEINKAEVHTDDKGNKYYKIPEETKVYRGAQNSVLNKDPPPFFGFFEKDVEQYGPVSGYIFNQDVKLLAIMEMDEKSDFYTSAPSNIKLILERNFGYNGTKIRGSTPESDKLIMRYLCKLKKTDPRYIIYNGYAMNGKKQTDTGNLFHPELAVCEGSTKSKKGDGFPFKDTTIYDDVTGSGMKSKKTTGNAPRVESKKKPPVDGSPNKNKFVGNLNSVFGDDSNSDNNKDSDKDSAKDSAKDREVSIKLQFGGNSRIRFKKRGKQTKRKGKRTKKVVIKYKKTRAKRKRGGGKKKKTVSFKSCKSDADCWISEPECDEKNNICVRKKIFHK
jgi:hypothetical protein